MTDPGYLTIAAVRSLTGLTERQIRYYDEKGLVVPDRTPGGHRLYTQAHVDRLIAVKQLLADGLTVEEVRERLTQAVPGSRRADDGQLEDVKIYFRSLRRPRHDGR